jgi:hypothetical protein
MMFMIPTPPTTIEMPATMVSIVETIERREPAGCRSSLPVTT